MFVFNFSFFQIAISSISKGFNLPPHVLKSLSQHYSLAIDGSKLVLTTPSSDDNYYDYEDLASDMLYKTYSPNGKHIVNKAQYSILKITFERYLKCCLRLKAFTDLFRERDRNQNKNESGICTFFYDEVNKPEKQIAE